MANLKYHKIFTIALLLSVMHNIVLAQTNVPELMALLQKENSTTKKADICFKLSIWYSDKLKIDSGLFFANKIKEHSEKTGYTTGMGKYYLSRALALYYRNRLVEAKENAEKAIEIFKGVKEMALLGRSYWQLATIQYNSDEGNIAIARKNYWISASYLFSSGDFSGRFRTYYWLARTYYKTSDLDSAAFYFIKALAMAEQLKDKLRIYETACWTGNLFLSLGELNNAYKYLDYGLKNAMPSTDKVGLRGFLQDYINSLILLNELAKADSAIKEFELINVKLNDDWGKITLNIIKGKLEYQRKNYPQALQYLQQAYSKMIVRKGSNYDIIEMVLLLGKTAYESGDYGNAIRHLHTAAQLSGKLKYLPDEMEANLLISKSYEKKNIPDSALKYFQLHTLLKDSMFSVQKQKNIVEITTRYETEKKEQAIKILEKETEANSYLLQLQTREIEKQHLEDEKKSQQLALISNQNEISKLDVSQKTLSLDNEKKENEKNRVKLKLLERETAYQKLYVANQRQQKKIVYTSIVAILALMGYGLYRYIRRRKLQSQQVVLNERLRISRELHDELGSTLSGIAMYSHLTREQIKTGKTQEVEKSLNNMQQTAGSMVDKLKDIVWLVNPEQDSLQKLMERLEDYAEEMAMLKNTEIKISMPPRLSAINLPVESRRNIYLFCKEALNNAVKYSDAELIELTMKELDHKKIEFSISDNGKGFNTISVKKGNGLLNMQQRAADINGIFSLKSSTGHGTIISLTCKIT
jgi:signal transduction histidine kinase